MAGAAVAEQSAPIVTAASASRWLILVTVIVGTFLGRLDQTIVNLALPKMISDFSITVSAAGWIGTAYILANAIFVPIWGKLGDTIGRKKVYLTGFILFIVGSVLAGLAWNYPSMILFRIIQAIAGSADYPTAMAIIAVTFPAPRERAQALGIWSTVFGAAAVLGPLIGGPLIDNFGWRAVFFINLPIGIIGTFMAMSFITESKLPERKRAFDWWGAIMLGISLAATVLVLDKGNEWGWLATESLISYAVAAISMLIFVRIESTHPEPVVDLKFFKNALFVETLANNFIVFMGLMGSIFLVPIFAQTFLGYTATQSGYLFIPMALGLMVAAPLGGALTGRVKPNIVIAASTAMAAFGMWLFSFLDPRSGVLDLTIPLLVMAFGMGFGMAQRTSSIASAVPPQEIGVASGVLALVRNIAGAFGIALFSTLLTVTVNNNVMAIAKGSTLNVHTPQALTEFITLITLKAQVDAYGVIYGTAGALLLLGAVVALFMRADDKKGKPDEPIFAEA